MSGKTAAEDIIPTVLIDEPELHLHPALQHNLVAYMRELASTGDAQFILCTHSTTIIDSASEGELYVLAPPAITGGNQLLPVASTAGRLATVRELTGSAFTVTRCRPIVFVEGEPVGSKAPADHRIIELLVPESKGWVLVPAHGRTESIRAATDVRRPALTGLPGLPVFALVDDDQGHESEPDFVVTWPAAMQENLLLDTHALWSWLAPHTKPGGSIPVSEEELARQLHTWCVERRDREIELRMRRLLPLLTIHESVTSTADLETLNTSLSGRVDEYVARVGGSEGIAAALQIATVQVDALLADPEQALRRFHGKDLLDRVYGTYATTAGWSGKAAFAYNLAAVVRAANSTRLREIVDVPVRRIQQYVPASLVACLNSLTAFPQLPAAAGLSSQIAYMRECWISATDAAVDRAKFRAEVLALARTCQASGLGAEQEELLTALAEFVVS